MTRFKQMNPAGTGVGWTQDATFWNQVICPDRLLIAVCEGTTGTPAVPSIQSSLWSGYIGGSNCGGSSIYVTAPVTNPSTLDIDIWKALADGAWSSSIAISIYAKGRTGFTVPPYSATVYAGPEDGANVPRCTGGFDVTNPVYATLGITVTQLYTSGNSCTNSLVGTLTVYDDGTFTLT